MPSITHIVDKTVDGPASITVAFQQTLAPGHRNPVAQLRGSNLIRYIINEKLRKKSFFSF